MPTRRQFVLGGTVAALVGAAPVVYSSHQGFHLRNLRVVEDGVLYRSGQLSPAGLERVCHDYGIKTVVTLRASKRNPNDSPQDAWEETFCADRGLSHVRIVPRVWGADETGEIPAEQGIREFLAVMEKKENLPVLVHCFAGIHRTGTMCAIYRMEYNGWTAERAMEEMRLYGFSPEDMQQQIAGYLRDYRPRGKHPGK